MQSMPRPPSDNLFQVAFKIPNDWLKSADELAAHMSTAGMAVTRTDVLRRALAGGLKALAADDAFARESTASARVDATSWRFDADRLELSPERFEFYGVRLAEMTTSAETLDWIMQLAAKPWMGVVDLGMFVQLIAKLLDPQVGMCSMGKDGEIDPVERLRARGLIPGKALEKTGKPKKR